ncbi:hypothetical protein GCM10009865_08640 [Aeromicrobium ponti]|uniref:Ornithine monooxygenase n=1 Tax=Cytobacillus oceanisediminis TaxID=665099 RepID=A0A562K7B8_9BACI|nr:VOC family protein [Cytobacillus oceanisediminis]TWH91302.1 hypothetical protein IQ19_00759 [Cytobacillus oceanisediminis]
MIYEMTVQIRVPDMEEGQRWYETLFNKKPHFIPHAGFAEWELIPGCWLQVAEGLPSNGCGPIRLGVVDLEGERERVMNELKVGDFKIFSRKEVPVKWATFTDPWGNKIGFFEYMEGQEKQAQINRILG